MLIIIIYALPCDWSQNVQIRMFLISLMHLPALAVMETWDVCSQSVVDTSSGLAFESVEIKLAFIINWCGFINFVSNPYTNLLRLIVSFVSI